MKTCTKCGATKALKEFPKDKLRKDGHKSACKECYSIYDKKRYWNNPESERKRSADYKSSLTEEQRYLSNRNTKLKRAYGISHDDYLLMLEQQNYKCACCGKDNKDAGIKGLVVDHNHTTGAIRELLCTQCNTALGLLKEDEFIIDSLLEYVRKHNRQESE